MSKIKVRVTFENPDQERVVRLVVLRQGLYLVHCVLQISLRELLRSVPHVLEREVVSLEQLECIGPQLHNTSDLEVSVDHVPAVQVVFLPLHELAAPDARVLVGVLVDLDGVVSAEEGDNELPLVLVPVLGYHPGLVPEDVLIVGKEFGHVLLRGLGLERVNAAETVLGGPVAIVGRDLVLDGPLLALLDSQRLEDDPEVLLVISFGEVVAIVDDAAPAKDVHFRSDAEVLRRVELLLYHIHSWVVRVNRLLRQLLLLQQQWKGVPARVLEPQLLHFHRVVGQEVVDLEVVEPSLQCIVCPEHLETEHFPVVVDVLLQAVVRMAPAQPHLDVLLILLSVWRVYFGILRPRELVEQV